MKYKLQDVANIKYGKNQKKVIDDNGSVPIYGTGGLMGYASRPLYEKPSVLIGRKGTIEKVRYVEHPFWTVDTLFYTEINEKVVIPKYLYYLFSLIDLKKYNEGTTIPSLRTDTLNKLELDIPKLTTQKSVLSIIDPIEYKIQQNEVINKNLHQQIGTIFKHWFTDNPSFDTMEQAPLADLCLVVTKGTTPTTLGKSFVSEGINFIKAESILNNHAFDKDKFSFIDTETNDLLKRSIINSGDIVFTIAGTLGRFALIDDSILPANTNQAVAIIRANQSKVTPEYLYSFFLGNWHNDFYTKRIQQAVQANLSLGTIKSLPIPILSNKDMSEYLGIIRPIIQMTKANELEITRLRTIRDTLLPQLMSGSLNVSNLDL